MYKLRFFGWLPIILAFTSIAQAQEQSGSKTTSPVVLAIILAMLALAPFALIMLTSFVKISVVLSILRSAMGTQQIPPNQVITGLSLILTIFIMAPVAEEMYKVSGAAGTSGELFSSAGVQSVIESMKRGREPLREFLQRNTHTPNLKLFFELSQHLAKKNGKDPNELTPGDFRTLVPAFITSQLTEAFQIGFLLFVPFLVIDMVISNILQAMGMFMLSPTIISLPFKLLLFILIKGWAILIQNLVLSYS